MENYNAKSIIIVGAGLAGLTAACYARMNGYKTTLIEGHNITGGYATRWMRKGYTFDGAMDWLNGINPEEKDSTIWRELGFLKNRKIQYFDNLCKVKDRDGSIWTFWSDTNKLESELSQLTDDAEDKKMIRRLCKDIDRLAKAPAIEFTVPETLMGLKDKFKMIWKFLPYIRILKEYNTVMNCDYAAKFRDPRLAEVMSYSFFDPAMPQSQFTMVYQMVGMIKKTLGFTQGGGHGLSEYLTNLFKSLGGRVLLKTSIKKILTNKHIAVGVETKSGEKYYAGTIVTACDGRSVIYNMLEGKYTNSHVEKAYKEGEAYPSLFRIYYGVDMDFKNEPHTMVHLLPYKLNLPGLYKGHTKDSICVRHYCGLDSSFAPPGKSVVNTCFFTDFDYWKNLRTTDIKRYRAEKQNVVELATAQIEKIYPGFADKIEVASAATPATYERYTGNYRGSIKGWLDDCTDISDHLSKFGMKLPGLENLYMIGAWVAHGGMIRVAASGRHAIQTICKRHHRTFKTSLPQDLSIAQLAVSKVLEQA
jgi:phytoene dehydrogenase-like protein